MLGNESVVVDILGVWGWFVCWTILGFIGCNKFELLTNCGETGSVDLGRL